MSTAAAAVGHDGVRMETPTILLASSGKAAPQLTRAWRGPGPHGLVLVASGSRGSKLIHVLPAEQPAAESADTVYGIDSDVLADALLPKPSQRERCLDVSLGEVRFVGHPVTLAPLAASSGAVPSPLGRQPSDRQLPSIDGLTVALVLAAHPPPGDEAAYEAAQRACVRGAAVLVRALQRTEARRRVVSRAVHTEAGAAGRRPGASLHAGLRRALETLRSGREEGLVLVLGAGGEGEEGEEAEDEDEDEDADDDEEEPLMLAPPPPPLSTRVGGLAVVPGAMPPPPPLRPYHALLLEQEPQALLRELPSDCSPLLLRLIESCSPLRSLQEVHLLTAIPLPALFRLASHLHQHRKARLVHTLTQDSVLAVHPRAHVCAESPLGRAFAAAFGRSEAPLRTSRLSGLRPPSSNGGWARHEANRGLLHAPLSHLSGGGSVAELGRAQGGMTGIAALAAAPTLPRALRVFSSPRRLGDLIDTATALGMRPHSLPAIAAWLLRHRALISLHTHVLELSQPQTADPADPVAVVRPYMYHLCRAPPSSLLLSLSPPSLSLRHRCHPALAPFDPRTPLYPALLTPRRLGGGATSSAGQCSTGSTPWRRSRGTRVLSGRCWPSCSSIMTRTSPLSSPRQRAMPSKRKTRVHSRLRHRGGEVALR